MMSINISSLTLGETDSQNVQLFYILEDKIQRVTANKNCTLKPLKESIYFNFQTNNRFALNVHTNVPQVTFNEHL